MAPSASHGASVKLWLRDGSAAAHGRIDVHPFTLDVRNECLWRGAQPIKLRPKAFAVLAHLVARPNELITKQELISAVWHDAFVGDAVLKVAIRQLRAALSDDSKTPRFIETAHRRGYRFIGDIGAATATPSDAAPAAPHTPPSAGRRDPEPGFVGRQLALVRLSEWFDRARGGERQLVFVTGEAGIGKTTLVDTFARHAGAVGLRQCRGQCLEQYGIVEAYLPVLDAIGQLCRDDPSVVEVLRRHAPSWLLQMPALLSTGDREAMAREVPGTTPARMLREMGDVLELLAAEQPLLLVLEDLHWSDGATLDLISYLARRRHYARLMVVGTFRPAELVVAGHPLRGLKQELAAKHICQELPLTYLDAEAVGAHLAARFPQHRFPPDLAALIHERTDGNPLFMVNTIDHLTTERMLERDDDGWHMTVPINAVKLGVPDSIRQLIDTQIDRLDAGDRLILEAASVAGAEFAVRTVAAALDEDVDHIDRRCEELSRRGQFVKPCGVETLPNAPASGRHGFVHAVFRHILYERLSASRRIHLHRRIGQYGERVHGDHTQGVAAGLAVHFEAAGDQLRAARYLQQAAVNALQRSAYGEAMTLSRRGLELLATQTPSDETDRQELWLLITLGVPTIATAGYAAPEVGEIYARARTLCDRCGTAPEVSQVLWGQWTYHALQADIRAALDIAGNFLLRADRIGDDGLAVRGHWAMEITCTHQGRFAAALEHFEQARGLYDPRRHRHHVFVDPLDPGVAMRGFAAWSLWFLGYPDRALTHSREALALAADAAEPHSLAHARAFAAVLHQLRRERALALEEADAAIALAREHGLVLYEAMARVVRGWALVGRNGLERPEAEIAAGIKAWEDTGARLLHPHFLTLLAESNAASRTSDGLLDEALRVATSSGERCYEAEIHRLRGERLADRTTNAARVRAARVCFQKALVTARRQGARSLELRAALSVARLDRRAGAGESGLERLASIYEQFDEGLDTADLCDARGVLESR